jgi:hypothetical protein
MLLLIKQNIKHLKQGRFGERARKLNKWKIIIHKIFLKIHNKFAIIIPQHDLNPQLQDVLFSTPIAIFYTNKASNIQKKEGSVKKQETKQVDTSTLQDFL